MSYLVLARKFRPQTFASVVGQEHITKSLGNAILLDRVPHALLLTGPRGVGKTTSARIVAKALNCTGRELPKPTDKLDLSKIEPCGSCTNCTEIANSVSMSVREIDGASNNSVDNVRELIESLRSLPPPGSKYKIYIIDEVHMLSTAAFNALLKSLEEPPPNTIFIFATTEIHKVPETVTSRCQQYTFVRLSVETITKALSEIALTEQVAKVEPEALEFIALKSQGGMRDAQSMLDRLISFTEGQVTLEAAQKIFGAVDRTILWQISSAVFAQDTHTIFEILDNVFSQSVDVRGFLNDFIAHWRNLLLVTVHRHSSEKASRDKTGGDSKLRSILEVTEAELAVLTQQTSELDQFTLSRYFDLASDIAQKALNSHFPRYLLEAGLVKMCTLQELRPIADIIQGLTTLPSSAAAAPAKASQGAPQPSTPRADLNWTELVEFISKTKRAVVLASHLKRSAPKVFAPGELSIEASRFDCAALNEKNVLTQLKSIVSEFSGIGSWNIKIIEAGEGAHPDSLDAMAKRSSLERSLQLKQEAENDPLVQSALKVFEGSKIDRVIELK